MPIREVIEIDEKLCDGCGDCVTACAEGAIEIIDGKARLVSDVYCDGLGACLGHCPQGALTVVQREAEAFDEEAVEARLADRRSSALPGTPQITVLGATAASGCPGSRTRVFEPPQIGGVVPGSGPASQLRHWPVQLHLVPPTAPFFRKSEVLLAADCVAFAVGDFHDRFLAGRSLAIACPKLDSNQEIYLQKLVAMIDEAEISGLTVMVMEVPCCSGLVRLASEAVRRAERKIVVNCLVIGTDGRLIGEQRVAG
jgi:NAD-dependent dihydropyrimidine dehydrogenase PreA subunit